MSRGVHAPLEIFDHRFGVTIPIPRTMPVSSTRMDFVTTLLGETYRFRLLWMGHKAYYVLDIMNHDEKRLFHRKVFVDQLYIIRGFSYSVDTPDAVVAIQDTSLERKRILPTNLGRTHALTVQLGQFRVAV